MMKKFLTAVLAVLTVVGFAACDGGNDGDGGATTYTVTFTQSGYNDVVKTVEAGGDLTDIPAVQPKTGYTVAWETVDLTGIDGNITVRAVETANTYTITYILNNESATISATEQTVTYDSTFTLYTPTTNVEDDLQFVGWVITDTQTPVESGKYQFDYDLSVTAVWDEAYCKDY